jgi:hypothetical protein
MVQLYFKLYLPTGTFPKVSWWSSILGYTYKQEPTLRYPGGALFQAIHTHRNLLSGILVELYFKLYLPTGTFPKVSWWSSILGYKYKQEPTLRYPGAALFQAIHTHRNYSQVAWCISISSYTYTQAPTPRYPVAVLFQAIPTYIHTGTFSWVSWCSSILSYTYTQEPSLGYPGAALFQALHTHRNLLSGILVQVYFREYIPTGTLSKNYCQVSRCSSISS